MAASFAFPEVHACIYTCVRVNTRKGIQKANPIHVLIRSSLSFPCSDICKGKLHFLHPCRQGYIQVNEADENIIKSLFEFRKYFFLKKQFKEKTNKKTSFIKSANSLWTNRSEHRRRIYQWRCILVTSPASFLITQHPINVKLQFINTTVCLCLVPTDVGSFYSREWRSEYAGCTQSSHGITLARH